MILQSRECLADLANALGLKAAVEIGTHQAVFAVQFMERFRGQLTCVDPWVGFDGVLPTFYPCVDETSRDREADYLIAKTALDQFGGRATIIRNYAENVVNDVADNSVGLVYIDALHDYEAVNRDLRSWYEKVEPNGIISGHDFTYDHPGVIHAVTRFSGEKRCPLFLTADEIPSWWMIKR